MADKYDDSRTFDLVCGDGGCGRAVDFPPNGTMHYYDTDPVFWVSRDVTRWQLDSLVEGARPYVPVSTDRWPHEKIEGFLHGLDDVVAKPGDRIVVEVPEAVTYEQFREFAHFARKYTNCGTGLSVIPADVWNWWQIAGEVVDDATPSG